jgi:hypothetical protein
MYKGALAKACNFAGSRGDGVHLWKESERAELRAELDAAYFLLYGIARDDVEYILTTFTNTGLIPEEERGTQQRMWQQHSPGELILDCYDALAAGRPWQPTAPVPEAKPDPDPPPGPKKPRRAPRKGSFWNP